MRSRTASFSSEREGAGRWGRGQLEGWTGATPSCWVLTPGSGVRFILQGLGSQGEGSAGTVASRGAVWSARSGVSSKQCGQCGQQGRRAVSVVSSQQNPEGRGAGLGPTRAGSWAQLSHNPGESTGSSSQLPSPTPTHTPSPRLPGPHPVLRGVWLLMPSYKYWGLTRQLGSP